MDEHTTDAGTALATPAAGETAPDTAERTAYAAPRGTCPGCGSGAVLHLVTGLPSPWERPGMPEWVRHVGSCAPPYPRICRSCQHVWAPADEGAEPGRARSAP